MSRGMTLIEMIITISVISILMLIAVPTTMTIISNAHLKSISNGLFSKLQLIRSQAIKKNAPVNVDLLSGTVWCYGFSTTGACNCNVASSCLYNGTEYVVASQSDENITMSLAGIATDFSFSGNQGVTSSSGTITFSNPDYAISIVISRLGRIKMCSANVAGYLAC